MRRIASAFFFFLCGIFTTWASCWMGSHMTFRLHIGERFAARTGCHEIDHCAAPWWAIAGLLAYLLGPSIAFALAGWHVGRAGTPWVKTVILLLALFGSTSAFFLLSYALEP